MGGSDGERDDSVRPRERELADKIDAQLTDFDRRKRPLPGIRDADSRVAFREQLLESSRRVRFVDIIRTRQFSDRRTNPNDEFFDPLMAAILRHRQGSPEEAFWLVFLFVHFGKHPLGGWRYAREVYGRLGEGGLWDWETTSRNPTAFRAWLNAHQSHLKRPGAGFGNHRKYESLDANSATGTGAVFESYIAWVAPPRSHQQMIAAGLKRTEGSAVLTFDLLYESMRAVARFGRLARFDYLAMLGKLGLAPISPGSPYLNGSSGPLRGAKLLFGQVEPASTFNAWVAELGEYLGFGMQVLEDALCNWQKSPARFIRFRG